MGLQPREQKVLALRFGLDEEESIGRWVTKWAGHGSRPGSLACARTYEEVGREFNVTRERIRQIEAKALRRLRHPSRLVTDKLPDIGGGVTSDTTSTRSTAALDTGVIR